MKKYVYPIIIAILVIISLASLCVAFTNYNDIKSIKSKYVNLDKKYSKLKKEDAKKDNEIKKVIKTSRDKDAQLSSFLKKFGGSSETSENQSISKNNAAETSNTTNQTTTSDSSNSDKTQKATTTDTATESDSNTINSFSESKTNEQEEQKTKDTEPQYAVASGESGRSLWKFAQSHGMTIDELHELNPNLDATDFKSGETYRIK